MTWSELRRYSSWSQWTSRSRGVIRSLGKLSLRIGVTALDGDGVHVALAGAVGDFVQGDALDNLTLQADEEMAAGVGLSRLSQAPRNNCGFCSAVVPGLPT